MPIMRRKGLFEFGGLTKGLLEEEPAADMMAGGGLERMVGWMKCGCGTGLDYIWPNPAIFPRRPATVPENSLRLCTTTLLSEGRHVVLNLCFTDIPDI